MSKALNTVGYQPNWDNIDALVEEGYIRRVNHPEDAALSLYNYTPKTQYEQHWTPDTLICRGLIARESGGHRQVIARPFPKFFNWQELEGERSLSEGSWQVYEKMDGSLGILYEFAPGDYRIATRGSFTSEQALKATQWIKEELGGIPPVVMQQGYTELFEIIYPENRIVVAYDQAELCYLCRLNTQTGEDEGWPRGICRSKLYAPKTFKLSVARNHGRYYSIYDYPNEKPNTEGYVLVNDKGFRVKVKHDEYVRLHKILTNTSSRTVWEYLSDPEKDFNELLDNVPDEFYEWVAGVERGLQEKYCEIEFDATCDLFDRPHGTRKEIAEYFKTCKHPSILFAMLDNKDYSGIIWKLIKPERVLPFANQEGKE